MGESKLPPIPIEKIIPLISWEYFFFTWKIKPDEEEAKKLKADAEALIKSLTKPEYALRAVQAFYPAAGTEKSVIFNTGRTGTNEDFVEVSTARQQNPEGTCLALCDYVAPANANTASVFASPAGKDWKSSKQNRAAAITTFSSCRLSPTASPKQALNT